MSGGYTHKVGERRKTIARKVTWVSQHNFFLERISKGKVKFVGGTCYKSNFSQLCENEALALSLCPSQSDDAEEDANGALGTCF